MGLGGAYGRGSQMNGDSGKVENVTVRHIARFFSHHCTLLLPSPHALVTISKPPSLSPSPCVAGTTKQSESGGSEGNGNRRAVDAGWSGIAAASRNDEDGWMMGGRGRVERHSGGEQKRGG